MAANSNTLTLAPTLQAVHRGGFACLTTQIRRAETMTQDAAMPRETSSQHSQRRHSGARGRHDGGGDRHGRSRSTRPPTAHLPSRRPATAQPVTTHAAQPVMTHAAQPRGIHVTATMHDAESTSRGEDAGDETRDASEIRQQRPILVLTKAQQSPNLAR